MPEYRYPGVYVEEIDAGVTSIPGASTSLDDSTLESLAAELRRRMPAYAPEWTGSNETDPGVTLIEIFAFLSESLLYRADRIPERGRTAAKRAAAALAAIGHWGERPCDTLKRPSFFSGQLLDAGSLAAEQDYQREKRRRHNRAVVGCGVISGLSVRVEGTPPTDGWRVIVEPGYAIDADGEEIAIPCPVTLGAPARGDSAFVTVRFWERPCLPDADARSSPPCVEEACVIAIASAAGVPAVALARLVRSGHVWRVDPLFRTPRAAGGAGSDATGT